MWTGETDEERRRMQKEQEALHASNQAAGAGGVSGPVRPAGELICSISLPCCYYCNLEEAGHFLRGDHLRREAPDDSGEGVHHERWLHRRVEVGAIEIGQGLWTKVKQMTAFALGQLCDGLDKVRVILIRADTLSMIQESCCEAVRKSCAALVERLKPIKEKAGTLPWKSLIAQASMASVKLTEHTYWTPDPTFPSYLNYGPAVEVDVLTGATTILRSDLILKI
uniref:Aldehyde oxidase/xanthine dehydrogenase second molybdopterin binding domain-containing protein n=1 Tax=Oryza meridionalis TaxID=40149 RepID=A0A0E0D881_9ORYZ